MQRADELGYARQRSSILAEQPLKKHGRRSEALQPPQNALYLSRLLEAKNTVVRRQYEAFVKLTECSDDSAQ